MSMQLATISEDRGEHPDFVLHGVSNAQIDALDAHWDGDRFASLGGEEIVTTRKSRDAWIVEVFGAMPAAVFIAELFGVEEADVIEQVA